MRPSRGFLAWHPYALAAAVSLSVYLGATAETGVTAAQEPEEGDTYTATILPLLQKYCIDCHGPEKSKADLRLDQLDPDMSHGAGGDLWAEALDLLEYDEMPPEKADAQPSAEERALLMAWIRAELDTAVALRSAERRTVLRRLNREQYTRSLQELLGLSIDFGRRLPDDGKSPMGFSNNGEVLRASALHLEYYQAIARDALDQAIVFGEQPAPTRYLVSFGSGVGVGHPGGRTGGYQSVPLNPDDFRVDPARRRRPRDRRRGRGGAGRNRAHQAPCDRRPARFARRTASHTVPEGVILYGALPHKEGRAGSVARSLAEHEAGDAARVPAGGRLRAARDRVARVPGDRAQGTPGRPRRADAARRSADA